MVPSRHIHPQGLPRLGETGNAARLGARALRAEPRRCSGRSTTSGARVGVPPVKDLLLDGWASHLLNLIAVSPAICAEPPDWPRWNRVCGFLALPATTHEQIAPELEAFLAAGEPPVFMGFGSLMPVELVVPDRDGGADEGGGAPGRLPRHHPGRSAARTERPLHDCRAHAARAGLPALRGGRAPLRRRHDPHHAQGRRAVGRRPARVRSIRLGRRTAAPRRGAGRRSAADR